MNLIHALGDKRARPFLLLVIFLGMLWLVTILYVIDLAALHFQNTKDAETFEILARKISASPSKAVTDPGDYVIREANQSLAAASLQKNVTAIAANLDVTLRSFETIGPRQEDPTGRIAAEIQFEIDERQLALFLFTIENFKPAIIIEHLSLQATKDRDAAATNRLQGSGIVVSAWQVSP